MELSELVKAKVEAGRHTGLQVRLADNNTMADAAKTTAPIGCDATLMDVHSVAPASILGWSVR
jgi:hypothetical protein